MKPAASTACPCGSGRPLARCCGPYVAGEQPAPDAEALMRSRYTAYVQGVTDYLLATWDEATRPADLDLADPPTRWLELHVRRHQIVDAEHAEVEFVARGRVNGRGFRLHENSRFVRRNGRWFYVDGDLHEK